MASVPLQKHTSDFPKTHPSLQNSHVQWKYPQIAVRCPRQGRAAQRTFDAHTVLPGCIPRLNTRHHVPAPFHNPQHKCLVEGSVWRAAGTPCPRRRGWQLRENTKIGPEQDRAAAELLGAPVMGAYLGGRLGLLHKCLVARHRGHLGVMLIALPMLLYIISFNCSSAAPWVQCSAWSQPHPRPAGRCSSSFARHRYRAPLKPA